MLPTELTGTLIKWRNHPRVRAPRKGLDYREPWVTWVVCAHHVDFFKIICKHTSFCILNTYVHPYIFIIYNYRNLHWFRTNWLCKKLGRLVGMSETDTKTGNHSLPIVARVSPGPDPASEPYVTRLKGTNEEREPQGKWMRKLGEAPRNTCISTPKLKGWPEGQTPKNNLPPGIRQSAQAHGAC